MVDTRFRASSFNAYPDEPDLFDRVEYHNPGPVVEPAYEAPRMSLGALGACIQRDPCDDCRERGGDDTYSIVGGFGTPRGPLPPSVRGREKARHELARLLSRAIGVKDPAELEVLVSRLYEDD